MYFLSTSMSYLDFIHFPADALVEAILSNFIFWFLKCSVPLFFGFGPQWKPFPMSVLTWENTFWSLTHPSGDFFISIKASFSLPFNSAIAVFRSFSLVLSLKLKNLGTAIYATIAINANITMISNKLNPSCLFTLMDIALSVFLIICNFP